MFSVLLRCGLSYLLVVCGVVSVAVVVTTIILSIFLKLNWQLKDTPICLLVFAANIIWSWAFSFDIFHHLLLFLFMAVLLTSFACAT